MQRAIAVVLLALAGLGYWRAMSKVEGTWGGAWGRWTWWTSIPLWAGAAVLAALFGGPGWATLVLVLGGLFAVVMLTQRSFRRSR